MAIRNDMFPKIQRRLLRIDIQCFPQRLPVKNINPHGCQITSGILGFFLKIRNPFVLVGNHDAEPLCLLHRHGHDGYRHLRVVFLMEIQHHLIIHLINMIPRKDQHIIRVKAVNVIHILINGIRGSGIPFAVGTFLIRG